MKVYDHGYCAIAHNHETEKIRRCEWHRTGDDEHLEGHASAWLRRLREECFLR
jgi:hypothetical protein